MINPFRRSVIEGAKSSVFKRGVVEKGEYAKAAGSGGFSSRQMEEKLKDEGYDPNRRRNIMSKILGKDKETGPSPEQIKRNILAARRSYEAGQAAKEVRGSRYQFGLQGAGTRPGADRVLGRVGNGVRGTAAGRFGLKTNSTGFAGQDTDKPASPPPSSPLPGASGGMRPGF